ncbi:sulfite exporter TauE/SafE family protein [Shewanella sp. 10N.261.52.F9]|uniref:sulfite exporter TauE/SafE family protein n=1 Tax=Shewanella TaxID=22 RepID=UPI0020104901|nr:sulfite exporter TauE/SafE family protein [Shewanella marinintestina]MCL1144857.1 sulfite exporter TauE/SafE family protein [Shewanella marinintestina]
MNELTKNRIVRNLWSIPIFLGLVALWSKLVLQSPNSFALIQDYLHYIFLGITGAIFANSTGAGGGVIFIPVFNSLNLTNEQSISTSFAIQCFGMTTGAVAWFSYYLQNKKHSWTQLPLLLLLLTPLSVAGLWTIESLMIPPLANLEYSFSLFSILLGITLIYSHSKLNKSLTPIRHQVELTDFIALGCISYLGGMITAWLSVGVGELIVIYLLLRKVEPTLAVATGVIVTAITVWTTAGIHLSADSDTNFNIVTFAGPGAIIGALIAKKLALFLPIDKLKLFFAAWIIVSGTAMLVM